VVLPQGQFAEFLHARPAARQQILVNLLGLSVYERIRDQATAEATKAEAHLSATDRLIADLSGASDEALAAATARVDELQRLSGAVESAVPALDRLLDGYAERDRLAAQLADLADGLGTAQAEHAKAVAALAAATTNAEAAAAAVRQAEHDAEAARTRDRAATLRPHLVAGQP